jgi:hypothetical protein
LENSDADHERHPSTTCLDENRENSRVASAKVDFSTVPTSKGQRSHPSPNIKGAMPRARLSKLPRTAVDADDLEEQSGIYLRNRNWKLRLQCEQEAKLALARGELIEKRLAERAGSVSLNRSAAEGSCACRIRSGASWDLRSSRTRPSFGSKSWSRGCWARFPRLMNV